MMKSGLTNIIEYLGADYDRNRNELSRVDVKRHAWATFSYIEKIIGTFPHATDPNWVIKEADRPDYQVEWLLYKADDGRYWNAKIRCSYDQDSKNIVVWLEHKLWFGADAHDSNGMYFQDWSGKAWEAQTQELKTKYPESDKAQPNFDVKPKNMLESIF